MAGRAPNAAKFITLNNNYSSPIMGLDYSGISRDYGLVICNHIGGISGVEELICQRQIGSLLKICSFISVYTVNEEVAVVSDNRG